MPGTIPATSQLDRLISMTAINVLAGSRAMRDRLKLFNVCMGSSIGSQRTMDAISTPPPHSIFHHGIRGSGGTILGAALPLVIGRSKRTYEPPHPSSREGHHSTARWGSSFLLSGLVLHGSHAAATSLVHRNAVPSTHTRCIITAKRRASATIAFFIPRCLTIFIAQPLSQDHFAERTNMLWAASYSIIRIISSPHRDIAPVRSFSPD